MRTSASTGIGASIRSPSCVPPSSSSPMAASCRAAPLASVGTEPRRLTLGEAALLVALPQSPEYRRPDRFPEAAKRARDRVLDRIAGHRLSSAAEIPPAE